MATHESDPSVQSLDARVAALEAQRAELQSLLKDLAFLLTYARNLQGQAVTQDLQRMVTTLESTSTDRS